MQVMQVRPKPSLKMSGGGVGWVVPTDIPAAEATALKWLYDNTAGAGWTDSTNWGVTNTASNWYGISVAAGRVQRIQPQSNNMVGNIAAWAIDEFATMTHMRLDGNASLVGDISGWTLPVTFLLLVVLEATGLTGDISSWTISANMQILYLTTTSLEGAPIMTSAVKLRDFRYHNCALPQATVDAILLSVYNRRAAFTFPAPKLNVGGTNAAPSGIYQDGDPPTTGKEYIYELVNDPETEGFNPWTITYTA